MMSSTDKKVEKKKRSFTFPKEGIVIQASSLEEAQTKLATRLKGEDK